VGRGYYVNELKISLVFVLITTGCAPTSGRIGLQPSRNSAHAAAQMNSRQIAAPTNAAQAAASPYCPNRLNRVRAGGAVGGVVGLVAASVLGSPLLGILYQIGGYTIGFASTDPCARQKLPDPTAITQTANAGPVLSETVAEKDQK
jgi:hypothetical protein